MNFSPYVLRKLGACEPQIALFRTVFGNTSHIEPTAENIRAAALVGLRVHWLQRKGLIDLEGRIEKGNGDVEHWEANELHRDGDLPAIERADGHKEWCIRGKRHRDGDQPAVIYASGHQEWRQDGKLHRVGGAALEHPDGSEDWYVNDLLTKHVDSKGVETIF